MGCGCGWAHHWGPGGRARPSKDVHQSVLLLRMMTAPRGVPSSASSLHPLPAPHPLGPSRALPHPPATQNSDWVLATCEYGGEFVAAVQRGAVSATQFHPEKSGAVGLDILGAFLDPQAAQAAARLQAPVVNTGEELLVLLLQPLAWAGPDQLLRSPQQLACSQAHAYLPPCLMLTGLRGMGWGVVGHCGAVQGGRGDWPSVSSPAWTCGPTTPATWW